MMIAAREIDRTVIGDNGAALDHLLDLAGPDIAPRLLAQMMRDLNSVRTGLALAADDLNWAELRAHSHVLISLAGTMGATDLHQSAIALNEAAHSAAVADVQAMMPDLMNGLGALIAMLNRWQGVA